jgi:hypothetical protein
MRRTLPPLALAALCLSAAGCGGGEETVASVEVTPRSVRLDFPQVHKLRMTWSPVAALGEGEQPTVFVHLLDDQGTVVRTFDHPFPQRWRETVPVSYNLDLYQSALAEPLPAGKYRLSLGLYGKENRRWPLEGLGEEIARYEYLAAEVEVPQRKRKPSPRFAYSPSWLPVEPGGDSQILARRWLFGPGAIRVGQMGGPGTAWMKLRIPEPSPEEKLVLDPGVSTPSVLVSGTCNGIETNVSGPGVHEIELPLQPPPPGAGYCKIQFRPNFHFAPAGPGPKRSVSLETLAWEPSEARAVAQ